MILKRNLDIYWCSIAATGAIAFVSTIVAWPLLN
jgi:hypothetical protein